MPAAITIRSIGDKFLITVELCKTPFPSRINTLKGSFLCEARTNPIEGSAQSFHALRSNKCHNNTQMFLQLN